MRAKEYLKQYEDLNRIAQRYKTEYQLEIERIDAIGSTLSGEPGMPHGTGISRKTEDKAIRLADKALKWQEAELRAIDKRQQIFELIADIKGVEGDILYQRYIMLHKWEEVCILVHMSWHGAHQAHRRALSMVQQRLEDRAL